MTRPLSSLLPFCYASVVALAFLACSSPVSSSGGGNSPTKGSLAITLTNHINTKTLSPSIDMNAANFTITGTGPDSATFTATSTGATVTENSLAFGAWTIVVNATNAAENLIGTGTATAQVNTGDATSANVVVIPITGTGTLSLSVNWPASQVQTPTIDASLIPALGSAQSLPFIVSGATASYSNSSVGSGYIPWTSLCSITRRWLQERSRWCASSRDRPPVGPMRSRT